MNYIENCHPMLSFEREIWDDGISFIAGIDEAGRGPLAGPVVVAAVIIPKTLSKIPAVNDSKKLTDKKRRELKLEIANTEGILYSIVEISAEEIDKINILRATHAAMKKAVLKLTDAQFALIDGLPVKNFPIPSKAIVKGDSKSASIAAASILAKVHRDEIMEEYAKKFPEFGFDKNKGYGTAEHLKVLKKLGPCPIHRKSFAPIKDILERPNQIQPEFDLF